MAYKYIVMWFRAAKMWLSGTPRPLETHCKPFRSLERAKEFQKKWCKPYPRIYELKEGYHEK